MHPPNKQKQPELFGKFFEPDMATPGNKHRQHKLGPFKKLTIAVSYEIVIVSCILILMATILSFAIGFERGKKISKQPVETATEGLTKKSVSEENTVVADPKKPILRKQTEKSILLEQKRNFAIQLIAYAKKDYALKEIEKLKGIGYTPFMDQGGKFFLVSIGPYLNRENAKRALKKVKSKSLYQDAFIKRVPKK